MIYQCKNKKERQNLACELNGTSCVTFLLIKSLDTFQQP